ncbi:MAG TPA: hypothetical protein PLA71_01015 [Saccharofermentans sp.]|nr:hypothetical protein [Saccharofermentans sp.]
MKTKSKIERVMILDYDRTIRKQNSDLLLRYCGIEHSNIQELDNPNIAYDLILKNGFDLLVTELDFYISEHLNGNNILRVAYSSGKKVIIASHYSEAKILTILKYAIPKEYWRHNVQWLTKPYLPSDFVASFKEVNHFDNQIDPSDICRKNLEDIRRMKKNSIFTRFPILSIF